MIPCELHVHTIMSDGIITCTTLVRQAMRRHINIVCITDHNTLPSSQFIDRVISMSRGRVLPIPGIEISTPIGHILIIGVDIRDRKILRIRNPAILLEYCNENSYFTIAPHPFDPIRRGVFLHIGELKINAIEAINGRSNILSNMIALWYATKNNIPYVCGSDAHIPQELGKALTYIDAEMEAEAVIDGLFRQRYFAPVRQYIGKITNFLPIGEKILTRFIRRR